MLLRSSDRSRFDLGVLGGRRPVRTLMKFSTVTCKAKLKWIYVHSIYSWIDSSLRRSPNINAAMPWFIIIFLFIYTGLAWKFFSATVQHRDAWQRCIYMYMIYIFLKGRIPLRPLIFMSYDNQGISITDPVTGSWAINKLPFWVFFEYCIKNVYM